MSLMNYGFTKSKVAMLDEDGTEEKRDGTEKSKTKVVKSSTKSPLKSTNKIKKEIASKSKSESPKMSPKKSTPQKSTNAKSPKENKASSITKILEPQDSMHSPSSASKLSSTSPKKASTDVSLPYVRIKMIMKSCPEVDMVPHEALHVITKATELFIQHLATESLKSSAQATESLKSTQATFLDYESLSRQVHTVENLEFLKETIPKKLFWEECQKIIAARRADSVNELL